MTKTSKPAAITFPTVKGLKGVRRNAETGIEIHNDGADGFAIFRTARDGSRDYRGNKPSLSEARTVAIYWAEAVRDEVAADHAEASDMDATETARVAAEVVAGADEVEAPAKLNAASRILHTLLVGARHSARAGFVQVGRDRLDRARRILSGDEQVPSNAQADDDLADALTRMAIGTLVMTDRGLARVYALPYVVAEQGRVALPVRFVGKGYGSVYAEAVELA